MLKVKQSTAPTVGVAAPVTTTPATSTTTPTATPQISYSTRVDPTFQQSSTNPLQVTYTYSADAVETINGTTTDLAQTGALPAGVLNLYTTDGNGTVSGLACSMNVGGSTSSGQCAVTYQQLGTYTITTQYITSSASSTTDSEQVTLQPGTPTASASIGTVNAGSIGNPAILPEAQALFPLVLTTTVGGNVPFTVTLTDETTGTSITGSAVSNDNQCLFDFLSTGTTYPDISDQASCGLPPASFNIADTIDAVLNEAASGPYGAVSTAPVQIWPLPNVNLWPNGTPTLIDGVWYLCNQGECIAQ